jgi:hypothetical protein
MNRMRERLFNVLCASFVAVCIAAIALWVASNYISLRAIYSWQPSTQFALSKGVAGVPSNSVCAFSFRTALYFQFESLGDTPRLGFQLSSFKPMNPLYSFEGKTPASRLGFGIGKSQYLRVPPPGTTKYWWVSIPYWLIIATTGLLAIRCFKVRRRKLNGCCAVCGYDLRATPDRCPECGKVVELIK